MMCNNRKKNVIVSILVAVLFLCSSCGGVGAQVSSQMQETYQVNQERQEGPKLSELRIAPPIKEEKDNPAGALQEVFGSAMVRITAGNLIGSGVIVKSSEKDVVIATAGHVFDRAEDFISLCFADGYQIETAGYTVSETTDLALITIPREELVEESDEGEYVRFYDHGPNYSCALLEREAYDGARVGDLVIAMGSFDGVGENSYAGVLVEDYIYTQDFGAYMMIANVPVKPGMSGGGLFDRQGHLLGILCGVSPEGQVAVAPFISLTAMME